MIRIRRVRPPEMGTVTRFIEKIFPESSVRIRENDIVLVAEASDGAAPNGEERSNIVGFVHVIDRGDRFILQGLGVDPFLRSQGVGTLLLEGALEVLGRETKPVYLKVKPLNPAVDLYERHGFSVCRFGRAHVLVKKPNQ